MKCNACWTDLEGRAISTICGHLLCTEDATKIISSNGGECPICDQILAESLMKPVDINPNEEWINMAMAGISPQTMMKTAYRSLMFYITQRDLEMQHMIDTYVAKCRQKCEGMQAEFNEKIEQVHTEYQKMGKRCQMMAVEMENLAKEKQELQEKFSEKSRQKRKLDELYDQLSSEYDSLKRPAIQPANNFYPRHQEPDLFPNPVFNMMEKREPIHKDLPSSSLPQPKKVIWPARRNISTSSLPKLSSGVGIGNRRAGTSTPQSARPHHVARSRLSNLFPTYTP